ncbi:MAG: UDP-N-acetylglucosamine--N-acetylmuramyl-(pentapeptide) pyrophosphoryl-undecaprenol N-acetylglucosamine transferase, partial [Lentisphaeria bacterium]|nr:UDP-N-acetylglucosamine--N-acetylmuramyl-(pentapeptide) pyrophosphoryl-undecaprenol N-acetylglucosamine transferase [Lentisphaeria bacterium]
CVNFPETLKYLPEEKAVLTGTPIRKELFQGDRLRGLQFCGFSTEKPVILVVGGSTGAAALNEAVWNLLPTLLKRFQIVHLCGKGKANPAYDGTAGYAQFEYINKELRDIFAVSSLVVSRAGANAICELLALKKPNILVPLTAAASRGDQILNAESFEQQGYSYLLKEEELTNETLLSAINEVYENKEKYLSAMNDKAGTDATHLICAMIDELIGDENK